MNDLSPLEKEAQLAQAELEKPVSTLAELENATHLARVHGKTYFFVTSEIMRYLLKDNYPPKSGFIHYRDIKLYESSEHKKAADQLEKTKVKDVLHKGASLEVDYGKLKS